MGVTSALLDAGFVHGPQRILPSAESGARTFFFPSLTNVVIVHTRHPIEAFVSHFFCLSNASVCPRRATLLREAGRDAAPPSISLGLDGFVLAELRANASSLSRMLSRQEELAGFVLRLRAAARGGATPARDGANCAISGVASRAGSLNVMVSRYEDLVSDFPSWLNSLFDLLPPTLGASRMRKQSVQRRLAARFKDDVSAPHM